MDKVMKNEKKGYILRNLFSNNKKIKEKKCFLILLE